MGWLSKSKGGSDGDSIDIHTILTSRPKATAARGTPQNLSATARCNTCGTSTEIPGRPGQTIRSFECRTCQTTSNQINDGRGFTFQGWN